MPPKIPPFRHGAQYYPQPYGPPAPDMDHTLLFGHYLGLGGVRLGGGIVFKDSDDRPRLNDTASADALEVVGRQDAVDPETGAARAIPLCLDLRTSSLQVQGLWTEM